MAHSRGYRCALPPPPIQPDREVERFTFLGRPGGRQVSIASFDFRASTELGPREFCFRARICPDATLLDGHWILPEDATVLGVPAGSRPCTGRSPPSPTGVASPRHTSANPDDNRLPLTLPGEPQPSLIGRTAIPRPGRQVSLHPRGRRFTIACSAWSTWPWWVKQESSRVSGERPRLRPGGACDLIHVGIVAAAAIRRRQECSLSYHPSSISSQASCCF